MVPVMSKSELYDALVKERSKSRPETCPSFDDILSETFAANPAVLEDRERRRPVHDALIARFDKPMDCPNPCYEKWRKWATGVVYTGFFLEFDTLCGSLWSVRYAVAREYSWAVPTRDAIDLCITSSNGRVVEVGSGTGYWASLLERHGCDIVAVDDHREGTRLTFFPKTVDQTGQDYLTANGGCKDRALMLCWPRSTEEIVGAFKGDIIIWIGELGDGCTGTIDEEHWMQGEVLEIPRWGGIRDVLVIYHRSS